MLQKFLKNNFSFFTGVSSVVLLLAFRLIKISPVWGGCFSYFSLTDVLMPLSGLGGFGLSLLLFATRIMFRTVFLNAGLISIVYHLPSLSASFYWANRSLQRAMGIIIPVICMLLFIVHPVGRQAMLYTAFWFIPFLLSLFGSRTPFERSITSSFIAHSVGSVIWLYTKNLTATEWLTLIPIVAIERLTFACILTAGFYAIQYAHKMYKMYRSNAYTPH